VRSVTGAFKKIPSAKQEQSPKGQTKGTRFRDEGTDQRSLLRGECDGFADWTKRCLPSLIRTKSMFDKFSLNFRRD